AFRTALALNPQADVPKGISPKVHAEWNSIKASIEKMKVPPLTPANPPVANPPVANPPVAVPPANPPAAKPNLAPVDKPAPEPSVTQPVPQEKSNGPYIAFGGALA